VLSTITFNNKKIIKSYTRTSLDLLNKFKYFLTLAEENPNINAPYHEGKYWVYNSSKNLSEKIFCSDRHTRRLLNELISSGILRKKKLDPHKNINYYTLDIDKMGELGFLREASQSKSQKQTGSQNNPTNTTTQDMLKIWNTAFPSNHTTMTKHTGSHLYQAYKKSFDCQMSKWIDYCNFLTQKYPRGISLDNALKFPMMNSYKGKETGKENAVSSITNHSVPVPVTESPTLQIREECLEDKLVTVSVKEMLDFWNKTFQAKEKRIIALNKELEILMANSLRENFDSDLSKWQNYCLTIATSSYIMSDKFTIRLTWFLEKENIARIFDKDLGVKEIVNSEQSFERTARKHIEEMEHLESPIYNLIREKFVELYGAPSYISWIKPVQLEIFNNELIIKIKSQFFKDHIKENFGKIFEFAKQILSQESRSSKRLKHRLNVDGYRRYRFTETETGPDQRRYFDKQESERKWNEAFNEPFIPSIYLDDDYVPHGCGPLPYERRVQTYHIPPKPTEQLHNLNIEVDLHHNFRKEDIAGTGPDKEAYSENTETAKEQKESNDDHIPCELEGEAQISHISQKPTKPLKHHLNVGVDPRYTFGIGMEPITETHPAQETYSEKNFEQNILEKIMFKMTFSAPLNGDGMRTSCPYGGGGGLGHYVRILYRYIITKSENNNRIQRTAPNSCAGNLNQNHQVSYDDKKIFNLVSQNFQGYFLRNKGVTTHSFDPTWKASETTKEYPIGSTLSPIPKNAFLCSTLNESQKIRNQKFGILEEVLGKNPEIDLYFHRKAKTSLPYFGGRPESRFFFLPSENSDSQKSTHLPSASLVPRASSGMKQAFRRYGVGMDENSFWDWKPQILLQFLPSGLPIVSQQGHISLKIYPSNDSDSQRSTHLPSASLVPRASSGMKQAFRKYEVGMDENSFWNWKPQIPLQFLPSGLPIVSQQGHIPLKIPPEGLNDKCGGSHNHQTIQNASKALKNGVFDHVNSYVGMDPPHTHRNEPTGSNRFAAKKKQGDPHPNRGTLFELSGRWAREFYDQTLFRAIGTEIREKPPPKTDVFERHYPLSQTTLFRRHLSSQNSHLKFHPP
jgi:hypothetical protein